MNCPIDSTPLVMSERSGVEIDYCPACRGVWLDRGELDKIIDRASEMAAPVAPAAAPMPPMPQMPGRPAERGYRDERSFGYRDDRGHSGYGDGRRKKRENWLSELFD